MAEWWSVGCEFDPYNILFDFKFYVIELIELHELPNLK